MKWILPIFFLFLASTGRAQDGEFSAPKFVKKQIGESGCTAYFPESDDGFSLEYSEDSSAVYTGEFASGDYTYGLILVKYADFEIEDPELLDETMTAYLDYLQSAFSIVASAGYGRGHTLSTNSEAIGIIDYWEDEEGDQWAIKAWGTKNAMAVFFIYGVESFPNMTTAEFFFNSIRF